MHKLNVGSVNHKLLKQDSRLFWLLVILAFGGWMVLLVSRVLAVRSGHGAYIDCMSCLDRTVLLQDLLPTALLVLLAATAMLLPRGVWRLLPVMGAFALVCVYAIDLGVYLVFGFRLRVTDFFRYSGEARSAWSVVLPLLADWRGATWMGGWVLALIGWIALIWHMPHRVRAAGVTGLLCVCLAATSLLTSPVEYVHVSAIRDVLRGNRPDGVNRQFSAHKRAALLAQPPTIEGKCRGTHPVPPRSVILLVVESLSAYHSQMLGGLQDNTPLLDAWARDTSYLPDFHANGFTTDGGLIALLTGRVPLPAVGRYESSKAYSGYEQPIVSDLFQQLHDASYSTQFFTASDLNFLDTGDWVRGLGFMHVEGASHPFYTHYPRGGFSEAGDQALYERYLDWYDSERNGGLHFSTLLTASTHPPFYVPGTSIGDEVQAFRWADKQIDVFIRGLETRRFFDNGVLLVTGDHRTMTIVRPAETARFGAGALSRVPMVIIGPSGLPLGAVPGRWQQADFLAGLLSVAGLPSCTDAFRGRLMGADSTTARYLLHTQGVQRDRIGVWVQDDPLPYELTMNGDDTGWITQPGEPAADQVLAHVNRERALLSPLPSNLMDMLIKSGLGPTPDSDANR